MRQLKSNLMVLAAEKGQREGRRISLLTVSQETGISKYTIYAFNANGLKDYPKDMLEKLCAYFDCELSDLLRLEERPSGTGKEGNLK